MLSHPHFSFSTLSSRKTLARSKTLGLALGLFTLGIAAANAQVFPPGNGISLTGKSRFDQYVEIRDWQNMVSEQGEFRLAAQREFESALKSVGVRRQPSSVDYLVCSVQAISNDGQIAYAVALEYWEKHSTDVHVLQWKNAGMSFLAQDAFAPATVAEQCAGYFSEEWQKWNQTNS